MPINVAIVEDNGALRRNLAAQCSFFPDIRCIGTYGTGEEALGALSPDGTAGAPDVVLMDIGLPGLDGIDVTIALRERFPGCDVLILTVFEDEERIFRAIRAGASGYLLKDEPFDAIIGAVRELRDGGAPMSPSIASKVLALIRAGAPSPAAAVDRPASAAPPLGGAPVAGPATHEALELSARELEILDGLVRGETYSTLAERLFISPHTVRTHIKNVYRKLHVQSRAAAVRVALQRGLI